jgi:hypothetical protein
LIRWRRSVGANGEYLTNGTADFAICNAVLVESRVHAAGRSNFIDWGKTLAIMPAIPAITRFRNPPINAISTRRD